MKKGNKDQESVMVRLATFVVDKRNLFFLLVIIGTIFTLFSRNWVEVENDLSSYLPIHSTTRQGLDVMEEQFTTFGTADLMVANISLEEARRVKAELLELDGVQSVEFDDTTDHYAHASALYSLTFDYDEDDERCLEALDRARESLTGWDVFVSTELGNTKGDIIDAEVNVCGGDRASGALADLTDLRRGPCAYPDLCYGHDFEPGQQFPAGKNLLRVQFRDQHPPACPVPGLRRDLL